jgi:NADH-quinone oxidoreductase subunit E
MFNYIGHHINFSPILSEFIAKWKNKPGSLIMILHRVQEEYKYVPRAVALELSKQLNVPLAKIYGVITFYHFFKLKKPGRNNIQVCLGTACYLKGGGDILQELENILGIGVNSVTPDGEFSIEAVRCVGCCGLAPVLVINGEVHGKLKKDQLPGILAKVKSKTEVKSV